MKTETICKFITITGLTWLISCCAGAPATPKPTILPLSSATPVPPTSTPTPTQTLLPSAIPPPADPELLTDLEEIIANEGQADSDMIGSIIERIMENPSGIVASILPRLSDSTQSETALIVYAWALGWTQDPLVVDPLVALAKDTTSTWVKMNCINSLGMIGGERSGEGLVSILDDTTDKDLRYELLNILAEMKYEPALPIMEEILAVDPNEEFWKPIFIFGKMGDLGVPFLLSKINDDDVNVRANSIFLLGQLLIVPEAAQPLRERYWIEEDQEIRGSILVSWEQIASDLEALKSFSEEVCNKEKDADLVKYAQETVDSLPDLRIRIDSFISEKHVSLPDFQAEYEALFDNYGYGNKEVLASASTLAHEQQLKKLRERALQRDSDEALYDYYEVNEIIRLNRFAQAIAEKEGKPWEAWPTATPEPTNTPEPPGFPPLGDNMLPAPSYSITGHWYALAISPDSKQIAISGDEGIEIFDATTLNRLYFFDQFDLGYITDLDFSSDGKKVAFIHSPFEGDYPASLSILDIDTPQTKVLESEPDEPLTFTIYLDYSPDGRFLVWGISSKDEDIILFFDSEAGDLLENQPDLPVLNIRSGAFSPDGKILGICCSEEAIILWDMQESRLVGEIPAAGKIGDLFFTPDGNSLMGRDWESQQIYNWDLRTLKPNQLADGFAYNPIKYDYGDFSFSPDGRFMAACYVSREGLSSNYVFVVFDAQTGGPIVSTESAHCLSFAFTPDGKRLVLLNSTNLQVYEMDRITK